MSPFLFPGQDKILVLLNNSNRARPVQVEVPGAKWADLGLFDLLKGKLAKPKGSPASIDLPPFTAAILKVQ